MLSKGLDGALAARMMQLQGIEVLGFHYATPIAESEVAAREWAQTLSIPLTVVRRDGDYYDLVRHPKFPRGEGANPCVDCRIATFAEANAALIGLEAHFVVSGEVLGQRPLGQKRRDLEIIARHSGLNDQLLRPLSARRLEITMPERNGWVDRHLLRDFVGASRKELFALARELGIEARPTPGPCCKLADPTYAKKVYDLLEIPPADETAETADFALLSIGRHFRISPLAKLIVARNQEEGTRLKEHFNRQAAPRMVLLWGDAGTTIAALLVGDTSPPTINEAVRVFGQTLARRTPGLHRVTVFLSPDGVREMTIAPEALGESVPPIA